MYFIHRMVDKDDEQEFHRLASRDENSKEHKNNNRMQTVNRYKIILATLFSILNLQCHIIYCIFGTTVSYELSKTIANKLIA